MGVCPPQHRQQAHTRGRRRALVRSTRAQHNVSYVSFAPLREWLAGWRELLALLLRQELGDRLEEERDFYKDLLDPPQQRSSLEPPREDGA